MNNPIFRRNGEGDKADAIEFIQVSGLEGLVVGAEERVERDEYRIARMKANGPMQGLIPFFYPFPSSSPSQAQIDIHHSFIHIILFHIISFH